MTILLIHTLRRLEAETDYHDVTTRKERGP